MKKHLTLFACIIASISISFQANASSVSATQNGETPTQKRWISDKNISAQIKNGELVVAWSTTTEVNCTGFKIEASQDGTNFTALKGVESKAVGGNSETTINYKESLPVSSLNVVLGSSLLAALGLGFGRSRKWKALSLVALSAVLITTACSKSEVTPNETSKKVFVRISQTDSDNVTHYSKAVQVTAVQ